MLCHTYAEDNCTRHVGSQDLKDVTRYGLGARGIDFMQAKTGIVMGSWCSESGGTLQDASFPLYDGHGNMVNTLSRGSGGSFTLGNSSFRYYDAWGALDTGPGAGNEPRQRYCANLGHLQDDESGLIYMRARYYEPGTGRFVSEDPAMDGSNWYSYCRNNPTNYRDANGREYEAEMDDLMFQLEMLLTLGRGDIPTYRAKRIMELMGAMETYIGLEESAAARHFEAAQLLSAAGSVEGARMQQAFGVKCQSSKVVGLIYLGQMLVALMGVVFGEL